VAPCSLIGGYQRFTFNPEGGGDTFLRKVGNHIQDYTTSQPRHLRSTNYRIFLNYLTGQGLKISGAEVPEFGLRLRRRVR
jgi:hypothetical protein